MRLPEADMVTQTFASIYQAKGLKVRYRSPSSFSDGCCLMVQCLNLLQHSVATLTELSS